MTEDEAVAAAFVLADAVKALRHTADEFERVLTGTGDPDSVKAATENLSKSLKRIAAFSGEVV